MWTARPLRRRCASAIVSWFLKFTDGIAVGVGGAMRCNDDIHSLKLHPPKTNMEPKNEGFS